MFKPRAAVIFGSVVVLSSCSDSVTKPHLTPSDRRPSLDVGAQQAATGGRASGHAETSRTLGSFSFTEKYSFIALSTEPSPTAPFAAKGEFQGQQVQVVAGAGLTITRSVHADIDCLRIVGNTATLSGPIERFVQDGQPIILPPGFNIVVTVQDNGEGPNSPPDRASPMGFFLTPQACQTATLVMFQSENGNIQVRQP